MFFFGGGGGGGGAGWTAQSASLTSLVPIDVMINPFLMQKKILIFLFYIIATQKHPY